VSILKKRSNAAVRCMNRPVPQGINPHLDINHGFAWTPLSTKLEDRRENDVVLTHFTHKVARDLGKISSEGT